MLLLPNRHHKDNSEAVHHKTLKAMDLEFKEDQTLQAIEDNSIKDAELGTGHNFALAPEDTAQSTKGFPDPGIHLNS